MHILLRYYNYIWIYSILVIFMSLIDIQKVSTIFGLVIIAKNVLYSPCNLFIIIHVRILNELSSFLAIRD